MTNVHVYYSRGTHVIQGGTEKWGGAQTNDKENKNNWMWREEKSREKKRTPAKMTEVEKRRREECGSCSVWECGWWDVSLEHERADILMESIIHAKWVTGWVSYFHTTRHKVPSISLSQSLTVSWSVFTSPFGIIELTRYKWSRDT